jgi:hypothetical protein
MSLLKPVEKVLEVCNINDFDWASFLGLTGVRKVQKAPDRAALNFAPTSSGYEHVLTIHGTSTA